VSAIRGVLTLHVLMMVACSAGDPTEPVEATKQPATVPVLCEALVQGQCEAGPDYGTCTCEFAAGQQSATCAGEVHTLLVCVDTDVRFECDHTGFPYPRGVVTDPDLPVLDEYCEEEWFDAVACLEAEGAVDEG
jgi:hypothetical protein